MKNIKIKRVYDGYDHGDGTRILVDRLWPRGIKKENAKIDKWMKEIAPSDALRKWYHADPGKWEDFQEKYAAELNDKQELCNELIKNSGDNITLVYSSKNREYNNAVALKNYLERK